MSTGPEKGLTAAQWRELVGFMQPMRRRLQELHEQLRPVADSLGDDQAELREEIRSTVLPGIGEDIDELKYNLRKAQLIAEFSARRSGDADHTVGWRW